LKFHVVHYLGKQDLRIIKFMEIKQHFTNQELSKSRVDIEKIF
jgi:hypothetical protein